MKYLLTTVVLFTLAASARAEVTFQRFHELMRSYCVECHNPADEKGNLDLAVFETKADFLADLHLIEDLEWVVAEKEMPVPDAPKHPTDSEREEMVTWLHDTLMEIQNAKPNDPGRVVMPRMSSKEFNYVIEDLTGKPYDLAQYLTSDTAGGEGFYNVGASQNLSIGQFESFMAVGKMLMTRSRFVPGLGIWWMPTPEPDLSSDEQLAEFLKDEWASWHESVHHEARERHQRELKRDTPFKGDGLGAYLEAAWQYQHRGALGNHGATFADIANAYEPKLYASGVEKVYEILTRQGLGNGKAENMANDNLLIRELARRWSELPQPGRGQVNGAREEVKQLIEWFDDVTNTNDWYQDSRSVDFQVEPVDRPESQQRRGYYHNGKGYLKLDLTKVPGDYFYLAGSGELYPSEKKPIVIWRDGKVQMKDGSTKPWNEVFEVIHDDNGRRIDFGDHPNRRVANDEIAIQTPGYIKLLIPDDAKILEINGEYDAGQSGKRVLRVLPSAEKPDNYTAAFYDRKVIGSKHANKDIRQAVGDMGEASQWDAHHRNLYDRRTVDNFYDAPENIRRYVGIEEEVNLEDHFNHWRNIFAWTPKEIRDSATEEQRETGKEIWAALSAAATHDGMSESQIRLAAGRSLKAFATKAWRGEPTGQQMAGLMDIYDHEIELGQPAENALETAMRAVVIAPQFLYRFTESQQREEPYPLQGRELATRLAFVLWSGLPDEELYSVADSGKLRNPTVLKQQIDRMLVDPKAGRFLEEFVGRWLGFAEFDEFSGPDQEKFKEFTPEIREAMHKEAKMFVKHLVREQKPITDVFFADYTFLNEPLAKHYGIKGVKGDEMRLVEIDDGKRGGVLGMGAFLTKTSTPLRTSPVHRGLWIYEEVLDLPVPEPPPVPQLSDEGVDESGKTITEQLAMHREDPACYSCHDRFDPIGVALENFDPIGRWRTEVDGKAPVNPLGEFRSGEAIDGITGLREYLKTRQEQLVEAFAVKLLGYSLGRAVLPTDKPAIEEIVATMEANNYSIRSAVHAALTTPQFLNRSDYVPDELHSSL